MLPLGFSDEEMDQLSTLASALPPPFRDDFLRFVAAKLSACPEQARGPGVLYRLAADAQRDLLKGGGAIAVGAGPKYSRAPPRRQGRRR